MPVSSRESSFFTSSGRSRARKITSSSKSPCLIQCVYGTDHKNFPHSASGNQSSHVLIVVVLSCGLVLRMIAQRLRRLPSCPFCCCKALRNISTQQPTDLPEPTGSRRPRKKLSSFINDLRTSPSGLYLNLVNLLIPAKLYHTFDSFRPYRSYEFICFIVCAKLFRVVNKVDFFTTLRKTSRSSIFKV